ncbi:MAG: hypothetical protein ACOC00_08600, partial [Halothiobacillaceae bacterium]
MIRRVTVPPHRPLSAPSRTGRFFGSAQRISRSGLLALGLASAPLAGHAEASAPLPSVIDEASGLARSSVHEGIFWTHNDNIALPASSGSGPPILYALKSDGQLAGQVTLTGANKRDWEAIARARWQARPVLLVGDIERGIVAMLENAAPAAEATAAGPEAPEVKPMWDYASIPDRFLLTNNAGAFGAIDTGVEVSCAPEPLSANVFSQQEGANTLDLAFNGQ